jgi:hypothetical protein
MKVLKKNERRINCVNYTKPCMGFIRHPIFGAPELMNIFLRVGPKLNS